MAYTFDVPVEAYAAQVSFPDICICCGRSKETDSTLRIIRHEVVKLKRSEKQVQRTVTLAVPHCARCQRQNRLNDSLSWISFFIGVIPVVVAAYFLYTWGYDWVINFLGAGGNPRLDSDAVTVVGVAALISGVPGGLLLEAVIKLVFTPFFGRSLFYAPPLAFQVFKDQDYIAGVTARLSKDMKTMQLKIHNPPVAEAVQRWQKPGA